MQRYPTQDQLRQGRRGLTQNERNVAFQHWVAYIRPNGFNVSVKEQLTCPFLWCGETFLDLNSVVQHASTCAWILNGWYWCPSCCRPEQLLDGKGFWAGVSPRSMQTKASKLRRAVTFFKYLGVKTGPKSNRPVPLSTHIAGCFEMPDEWSKSYGISEMDDTADVFRKPVELASHSYEEMEASLPERHELQGQNVYTNSTFHSNEHNNSRMQKAPHRKPVPAPSPNSVKSAAMPIDAPHTMHEDKQRNQVLISPISPTSPSFPFSPVSPIDESSSYHNIPATAAVSRDTSGMLNPTCEPFISMQFLRCVSESYLPQLPAYDSNNTSSDTPVVATQLQVQELREVVHVLNIEWTRRLSSATHLNLPLPVYYVPSLFETGIVALKKCFENKLPQNLDEIFALIHVACAITYTMHGNDASYDWSGFFQDMLQWQHAILNERDKLLLVTAINLLWSPEGAPTDFAYRNMRDEPYGTNTLETVATLSFALHAGFQTPFVLNTTQPMEAPYSWQSSESMRLLSMLKNGKTIRESARFFIGKPVSL